ncbi:MAG: GUN4 domain-containing protein [Cyanobacteria bacterium J06639_16]
MKETNRSEEQWRELFRLTLITNKDSDRFRQAFYQMLAEQNNVAFKVLESEMRQLRSELLDKDLCSQLEKYLSSGDWQKADEETAWLFYLTMVRQNYLNWFELCQKFPDEILKEIDDLWVAHSGGRFGLSVQRCIWEGFGGTLSGESEHTEVYDFFDSPEEFESWTKFCQKVEWCISEKWILENPNLLSLEFLKPCLDSFKRHSNSSIKRQRKFSWWISYESVLSLKKYKGELAIGALPALHANGQWGFLFKRGISGGSWGIRKELRALFSHQALVDKH